MKSFRLFCLLAFCAAEEKFRKVIAVFEQEVNFKSSFKLYVEPQYEKEILKGSRSFQHQIFRPKNYVTITNFKPFR